MLFCNAGLTTLFLSRLPINHLFQVEQNELAKSTLYSLESTISKRRAELDEQKEGKPSWTKRLLLDDKLLCSKIR